MRVPTPYEEELLNVHGPWRVVPCTAGPGDVMSAKEYEVVAEMVRIGWMEILPCEKGCKHAFMTKAGAEALRLKKLASDPSR